MPDHGRDPAIPGYDEHWLGAVLPGVAASLGEWFDLPAVPLPAAERVCLVLVDGLGLQLLIENASTAPFLDSLRTEGGRALRCGVPSTTATSLSSLGTGLPPGEHGLVGYEVLDPDRGVLLNELRWDDAVDPLRWQPYPTIFQRLTHRRVTSTGNPEFEGSGFNAAALRGSRFVGAKRLDERVELARQTLAEPGLFYLYWGGLDAVGHAEGCRTPQWRDELGRVDAELRRLADGLPAGTLLLVTADHGMVDVPHADRIDLADRPALCQDVRLLAGEPRFVQAHCEPGTAAAVARRWEDAFGDRAWVRTREEAIAAGWFGPVDDRVRPRIGEVLVAARDSFALVDSRVTRPHVLSLIGQHGSLTEAELSIPLLVAVR